MPPLTSQSQYYIVAWSNGVSSVHASYDGALRQIRNLRGEGDQFRPRDTENVWKAARAKIITVASLGEEEINA